MDGQIPTRATKTVPSCSSPGAAAAAAFAAGSINPLAQAEGSFERWLPTSSAAALTYPAFSGQVLDGIWDLAGGPRLSCTVRAALEGLVPVGLALRIQALVAAPRDRIVPAVGAREHASTWSIWRPHDTLAVDPGVSFVASAPSMTHEENCDQGAYKACGHCADEKRHDPEAPAGCSGSSRGIQNCEPIIIFLETGSSSPGGGCQLGNSSCSCPRRDQRYRDYK